jgi:Glycosyl hydrolase catalytic core
MTEHDRARRQLMLGATFSSVALFGLAGCGGGGGASTPTTSSPASTPVAAPPPPAPPPGTPAPPPPAPSPAPASTKSAKRGIAYDIASAADLQALAPGVNWWYSWSLRPNAAAPADYLASYAVDFQPMLWNGNFDATDVESFLHAHPEVAHLLLLNEPNLVDQSNQTPQQAAALWPRYEAIAAATGVKLVGPAMTWGTMTGYSDPVVWLDAFYAAYRSANGNRDPQIDYIAFHWYDYGLDDQLNRLTKYGKPFWVTEFANWHSPTDGAQIDTLAKQKDQMSQMVAVCEQRADVFRYAWFTGRLSPDPHFTSLLGSNGALSELGQYYLSLPFTVAAT